ncbi:uncharacterized protein MONBRDRAFT_32243 [Monosiga brevicollis MX1]|uniref:Polyhydroxybutyrate depolymerase n=1 Tax=Monosiga brevicollis TaxID=81824 RepID=A9UYC1_MONBE|nr:uncharacterized protein MONBRDRAFT_32243 [Monosiga brevicollis MX1]EDQ89437.1 predicted protein [Monosiga brevicollis MX1]|eukprot:XP_001745466.1 hypothetical protein [Monosiga brevicollis MX1]
MLTKTFVALACLAATATASWPDIQVSSQNVTVSGLSAGAFFAVQYHVAFSASITGAGIVAGGPYYCAEDEMAEALTMCMNTPEMINLERLYSATEGFAASKSIDATSNMASDNVYLYSGTNDHVVNSAAMHKLQTYYEHYVTNGNITTEYTVDSAHGMPTLDYGNPCSLQGEPYIQKCEYDGAGHILQTLYGTLNPRGTASDSNIISFDQTAFGSADALLGPTGYMYVPTACRNASACRLHIVFHGCQQQIERIHEDYIKHTGYNEWAESNNLVILYPQCKATELVGNPNACFDWWGYTNKQYATQNGSQMKVIRAMQDKLTGASK